MTRPRPGARVSLRRVSLRRVSRRRVSRPRVSRPRVSLRRVSLRRAAVLVAAVVAALGVSAGLGGTAGAAAQLPASVAPCAASAAGVCSVDPSTVSASWGTLSGVFAVELSWVGTGRPAGAPAPATTAVVLTQADGSCGPQGLGAIGCTWSWPSGLTDSGTILDGSYTLAPCGLGSGGTTCTSSSAYSPASLELVVAPPAPTGLRATVGGTGRVALSWSAVGLPDVAGYTLLRHGAAISTCYEHGAGPAGAPACSSPPSAVDRPGAGMWAYRVVALRYGAGATDLVGSASSGAVSAHVSASAGPPPTTTTTAPPHGPPTTGGGGGAPTTTVPGSSSTTAPVTAHHGSGGSGGGSSTAGASTAGASTGGSAGDGTGDGSALGLPPLDTSGTLPPLRGVAPVDGGVSATGGAFPSASPTATTTTTTAPGYGEHLPYGTSRAVGATTGREVAVGSPQPAGRASLRGPASVAGGLLLLAVAAHAWFIRGAARRRRA